MFLDYFALGVLIFCISGDILWDYYFYMIFPT